MKHPLPNKWLLSDDGLRSGLMIVLVLCGIIQLMLITSVAFGHLEASGIIPKVEHETLFFIGGALLSIVGVAVLRLFKAPLSVFFITIEVLLTILLIAAKYKTIIFDYRAMLATNTLYILLILAIMHKIFAAPFEKIVQEWWRLLHYHANQVVLRVGFDVMMVLILFIILWIPDTTACLARVFIGEQFHHIDHFIMAPGWAYLKGGVPYVDMLSEYGVGIPVVITQLSKIFGKFSYESVYQTILWINIIYYLLYYVFLRQLVQSRLIAGAAIALGIKFQMFYTLSYPLVFTYPSSTVARHMFDVFFWLFMYRHTVSLKSRWLWLMAIACGLSLFHMTATGMCLGVAFGTYLLCLVLRREIHWLKAGGALALTACIWIGLYSVVIGKQAFEATFWFNMRDFVRLFTSGFFMGPFWTGLYSRQLIDVAIACIFPIVYLATVLVIGSRFFLGMTDKRPLVALCLAIYGLGVFHHHVVMSLANNYYTMALSYVAILGFWLMSWIVTFPVNRQRLIKVSAFALCWYALLTNHHFTSYPNLINFAHNPMTDQQIAEPLPDRIPYFFHKFYRYEESYKVKKNNFGETDEQIFVEKDFSSDEQLKEYYRREFDFSKDAGMINRLTAVDSKVPVISSFEVKFLMQADRRPFFYYFPLLDTKPMHFRLFGIANLFTVDHLKNILNDFDKAKPPYVFIERILLTDEYPKEYEYDLYGLLDIIRYVKKHYDIVEQGQYLVAMKRHD